MVPRSRRESENKGEDYDQEQQRRVEKMLDVRYSHYYGGA